MNDFFATIILGICHCALLLYLYIPARKYLDIQSMWVDLLFFPVSLLITLIISILICSIIDTIWSRIVKNFTREKISVIHEGKSLQPHIVSYAPPLEGIPDLRIPLQQQTHHTSQQQDEDYYYKRKMARKGYWKVTPKQIREMDWREFESFVADLLTKQGYKTILTPAQKDEGKDIVAEKDGIKYFIECKHWKEGSSVGREYLQKLVGAAAGCGVTNVIFIATCSFHDNAKIYAKKTNRAGTFHIELWNMNKLLEVANRVPQKPKGVNRK